MLSETAKEKYKRRLKQFEDAVTVYPVSCESLARGRADQQWLDEVIEGGAKIVQLRDKKSSDAVLLEKAKYFRKRTQEAGVLFIINDRADIALMADADGIHVGQGDLPPSELRQILPDKIIGLSCNTPDDVKRLAAAGDSMSNPVSYYNIGPLFSTTTKQGLKEFLGVAAIADFTTYCSLPYTVMGGIKEAHIKELIAVGVQRIAVVTALSQAANIKKETARWMQLITENRNER